MLAPARPALHRRPARRAVRDHPGRPGDRRAADDRAPARSTRSSARCCCARRAAPRGGASTPRSRRGRPPAREVLDGALVIFGGALLLTPGFITDIFGVAAAAAAVARAVRPRRRCVRAAFGRLFAGLGTVGGARRRARRDGAGRGRTTTSTATADATIDPPHLPRDDRPRARGGRGPPGRRRGFSDAVTFAFGDPERGALRARARSASSPGEPVRASGLALLFSRRRARRGATPTGGIELAAEADWTRARAPATCASRSIEPLERWRASPSTATTAASS